MAPQNVYQPQDAVQQGIRCGAIGAGSGLFMAAARNSLSHERLGVMTVFTRTGHLVGFPGEWPGRPREPGLPQLVLTRL